MKKEQETSNTHHFFAGLCHTVSPEYTLSDDHIPEMCSRERTIQMVLALRQAGILQLDKFTKTQIETMVTSKVNEFTAMYSRIESKHIQGQLQRWRQSIARSVGAQCRDDNLDKIVAESDGVLSRYPFYAQNILAYKDDTESQKTKLCFEVVASPKPVLQVLAIIVLSTGELCVGFTPVDTCSIISSTQEMFGEAVCNDEVNKCIMLPRPIADVS